AGTPVRDQFGCRRKPHRADASRRTRAIRRARCASTHRGCSRNRAQSPPAKHRIGRSPKIVALVFAGNPGRSYRRNLARRTNRSKDTSTGGGNVMSSPNFLLDPATALNARLLRVANRERRLRLWCKIAGCWALWGLAALLLGIVERQAGRSLPYAGP